MKLHILAVDDSTDMLEVLSRHLHAQGHKCFLANNAIDAIDLLKSNLPDLLITDLQMPGVNGMQLIRYAHQHFPSLPILVITGFPTVENAVEVMQSGAVAYLPKPFTGQELEQAIDKIWKEQKIAEPQHQTEPSTLPGLLGKSPAFKQLTEFIHRIKDTRITTLITGESGTGKELVARAIHYSSKNANTPFVAVNCGAIPENLLESELFGYVKGAFTGAENSRAGFFQAANGGTIFLDEIGNASNGVQLRLLRAIQEKEIQMVGANKPQKVEVRIIAATNGNLQQQVTQGTFREDLYYRLNVINIHVPSLRDRTEDIPLLAEHFLKKYAKELNKSHVVYSASTLEALCNYQWPGNIRELENAVQRALVMAQNEITSELFPEIMRQPQVFSQVQNQWVTLRQQERNYIQAVLQHTGNNKSKAAQILGITRKTLAQKLKD